MKYVTQILTVLILTSLVLACATKPDSPQLNWEQQHKQITHLTRWSAQGSVSIKQKMHTTITRFKWQQEHEHYQLKISDPLGIAYVLITGQPGIAKLWQSQNEAIVTDSPEALLARQTHWHLPISQLHYWIRGLPAPGSFKTLQRNKRKQLIRLQQQGWKIHYRNYQRVGRLQLPKQIDFQYGELRVRLVISKWWRLSSKV